MNTRKEFLLHTVEDYAVFLAEMEATEKNRRYMNRVYAMLNGAEPGDRIEIDKITLPANLKKFIGCVCLYILDTERAEFDNEYKTVKKL